LLKLSTLLLLVLVGCSDPSSYLARIEPENLRARIDHLKASIQDTSTTRDNVAERVEVVWAWANEMALAQKGLQFAPNLPLVIKNLVVELDGTNYLQELFEPRFSSAEKAQAKAKQNRVVNRLMKRLDAYILELSLREDEPTAFGVLTSETRGPFVAHSYNTIVQTWTVGSRELATGAFFLIGRHHNNDQGFLQVESPQADNYLSIQSDRPDVEFSVAEKSKFGHHGGGLRSLVFLMRLTRSLIALGISDAKGASALTRL